MRLFLTRKPRARQSDNNSSDVTNFDRAKVFYETIFDLDIKTRDFDSFKMGIFSDSERQVAGAICHGEWYVPGNEGLLIYLNANPDLDHVLEKIEDAGGEIISEKKQISEQMGYMALFNDPKETESRCDLISNE